jgi:hypothetical protein
MELDLQSLFGLHVHSCTHCCDPATSLPRIWAHIRGRYWSAKIDDISLWPPDLFLTRCLANHFLSYWAFLANRMFLHTQGLITNQFIPTRIYNQSDYSCQGLSPVNQFLPGPLSKQLIPDKAYTITSPISQFLPGSLASQIILPGP